MSENPDRTDELERANQRLRAGLRQCHELVADLRHKLAANLNDPPTDEGDEAWPDATSD